MTSSIFSFGHSMHRPLAPVLSGGCVALMLLPVWLITLHPTDVKSLSFYVLIPLLMLIARNLGHSAPSGLRAGSTVPLTLFAAFVVYLLANWYFLSYPYQGKQMITFWWIALACFVAGAFLLTKQEVFAGFPWGLMIAGSIGSIFLFCEKWGVVPPLGKSGGVSGLFGTANGFGFVIVGSLPWTLFLAAKATHHRLRWAMLASALVQFTALVISASRGSIVLVVASLVFVVPSLPAVAGLRIRTRERLFAYAAAVIVLLIALNDNYLWNKFAKVATQGIHNRDISARLALWSSQIQLFLKHPIWGAGVGNFPHLSVPFWPESLRAHGLSSKAIAYHGHNEFLETLCELGVVGALFEACFLLGAVYLGIKELRRKHTPENYIMLVVFLLWLIHAGYCVASRTFPGGQLLWASAGFFWGTCFHQGWNRLPRTMRRSSATVAGTLHIVMLAFLGQILLSDVLYFSSLQTAGNRQLSMDKLIKSLTVCPHNPNALFNLAYRMLRIGEFEQARNLVAELDRVAPNIKPTDLVRAASAYGTGDYPAALHFAEVEINQRPFLLEAHEVKAEALAKLRRCRQLDRYRDSLWVQQALRGVAGRPSLPNGGSTADRKSNQVRNLRRYHQYAARRSNLVQLKHILSVPCIPHSAGSQQGSSGG